MEKSRAGVGIILALLLSLLGASRAHAFSGTANEIEVVNGAIGIVDPLIVAKGGTGRASLDAEAVLVGDGTNQVKMISTATEGEVLTFTGGVVVFGPVDLADGDAVTGALPVGNGGTGLSTDPPLDDTFLVGTGAALEYTTALTDCDAADEAVTYNATTNDFGCHSIASTAANGILAFSTNSDLTGGSTVYASPGVSETSEARGQNIAAVGMTLDSLNCVSTAVPGGSDTITITMADGACTAGLTPSGTQVCTITSAARTCSEAGAGEAVTAGECYAFEITSTGTANTAVVSCNIERTS